MAETNNKQTSFVILGKKFTKKKLECLEIRDWDETFNSILKLIFHFDPRRGDFCFYLNSWSVIRTSPRRKIWMSRNLNCGHLL